MSREHLFPFVHELRIGNVLAPEAHASHRDSAFPEAGASLTMGFPSWSLGTSAGHPIIQLHPVTRKLLSMLLFVFDLNLIDIGPVFARHKDAVSLRIPGNAVEHINLRVAGQIRTKRR